MLKEYAINEPTPEIKAFHERWQRNRDFIGGEGPVKKAEQGYLPKIRPDDGDKHYQTMLANTCFYPATAKIAQGIEGLIFRNPAVLKTDSARAALLAQSITWRNRSYVECARRFIREKLTTGFTGLFVDHPRKEQFANIDPTNADRAGYRPRLSIYIAESILEVTEGPVGLNHQLVNVRLLEEGGKTVRQLLINDAGFYEQRIYRQDGLGSFDGSKYEMIEPTINGQRLTEIPFVLDNDDEGTSPGPSLLESHVDLNLAHYRLSGWLANMTWMTSGPVLVLPGFSREVDDNGQEVDPEWDFGPNSILEIESPDVKPYYFPFDPANSTLIIQQLATIKTELSILSNSILAPEKAAPESPEVLLLRRVAENATMSGFAASGSASFERALRFWAAYIDEKPISFSFNTDFQPAGLTPAEHEQRRKDWESGAITHATYLKTLKQGEIYDAGMDEEVEAELARAEVENRPTLGL